MKPKIFRNSIFIAFLLLLGAKNSFAQYPGMGAVYRQIDRQVANQQMQMTSQLRMMSEMLRMRGVTATPVEYDFEVLLRDSITMVVHSAMYADSATRRHFIVLIDKRYKKSDTSRYKKIFPSQTLYIQRNTEQDNINATASVYYKGEPTDSCWKFKVITGAITAWSYSAEQEGHYFDPGSIVAIQLNNGPILNFNEANLKLLLGDDINALEIINKKYYYNYYQAIKRFNKDAEKAAKK